MLCGFRAGFDFVTFSTSLTQLKQGHQIYSLQARSGLQGCSLQPLGSWQAREFWGGAKAVESGATELCWACPLAEGGHVKAELMQPCDCLICGFHLWPHCCSLPLALSPLLLALPLLLLTPLPSSPEPSHEEPHGPDLPWGTGQV